MKMSFATIILMLLAIGCTPSYPPRDMTAIIQNAEMGDTNAQAELGYSYQYGDGIEKNPNEALKWNLKAASKGNAMAQHNLAVMYDEGIDIPEDNAEAIKWYRKAAERKHPRAQFNLGVMYWRGEGVSKDLEQAWNLFNLVRISSADEQAKWAARGALDEIKNEIRAHTGTFGYPEWEVLKESTK